MERLVSEFQQNCLNVDCAKQKHFSFRTLQYHRKDHPRDLNILTVD